MLPANCRLFGKLDSDPGFQVAHTRLGEPDARGRQSAEIVPGSESTMCADVVIIAFGLQPDPPEWLGAYGIALETNGRIKVTPALARKQRTNASTTLPCQTSNPKVFAGGDGVRGADLVVTATYEGREEAAGIVRLLLG